MSDDENRDPDVDAMMASKRGNLVAGVVAGVFVLGLILMAVFLSSLGNMQFPG